MKNSDKTEAQIHDEMEAMRRRIAELEALATKRQRIEEALRDSEERYRVLYEDNPSMYFTVDAEGTVLSVNQFGAEQLGYVADELVGQEVLNVFHEDDKEAVVRQLDECIQTPREAFHWEFRKIHRDGRVMWVREEARAVRDTDGRTVVLIVCEDITDRKDAESALREAHNELERRVQERTVALHESREHFRRLVETAHVIPWEADLATWRFTYVGPQAESILGYPAERWYEKDFWVGRIHPEDRGYAVDCCRNYSEQKQSFEFEYRMLSADGRVVWMRDLVTVVPGEDGSRRLRGFLFDITERKRLEKEILDFSTRERQRIGQDLHDGLGQHLTGIAFLSKVLQQKLSARSQEEAGDAGQIAVLVNQAINRTRDLARVLSPVQLDASGLVAALEELTGKTESLFGISCRFDCERPVLLHDSAVSTHLYYIGQEAINNAIKHGQPHQVRVALASEKGRITMAVTDDGVGIPETLEEPSGMGLHIMNYRARMIDGTLTIQRRPEGGTSVVCTLQDPAARRT